MSELDIVFKPFSELLSNVVDNRGKTCPTAPSGLALIATNCIKNDNLHPVYENVRYVSDETYKTWFRGHPLPGDLIFVTKGTPGRVCLVPSKVDFCIAQDMVAIRADDKKVNPKYLFAALRSGEIQSGIENLHVGSLIPHFKKGDFDKLLIPLPERELQEYIGEQYFMFSAKIDLLHRQNKTLEGMAEALWRKMFVEEADPGWKKGKLGDVAENFREGVTAKNLQDHEHYIGLEHIEKKHFALYSWGDTEDVASNKSQFCKRDILFGKLRAYFHKVCFAPIDGICSTDILVIRPKKPDYFSFCLLWFFNEDVVNYSDASSGGTRMPRTNWETLADYKILIPREDEITHFNDQTSALLDKIERNIFSIRTLSRLRDTLLPKLMSGEVKVRKEELV